MSIFKSGEKKSRTTSPELEGASYSGKVLPVNVDIGPIKEPNTGHHDYREIKKKDAKGN